MAPAVFFLSSGDANKAIEYDTNFGRDTDTIATMADAVTGAGGIKKLWLDKALAGNKRQEWFADDMTELVALRRNEKAYALALIDAI